MVANFRSPFTLVSFGKLEWSAAHSAAMKPQGYREPPRSAAFTAADQERVKTKSSANVEMGWMRREPPTASGEGSKNVS